MNFHHIGVACKNLDGEAARWVELGYVQEGLDFADPVQGIIGRFLIGGGPRLELLVGSSKDSVLSPWLNGGVKMYHMAYEVAVMDEMIAKLRESGAKVMVKPVPAVAFGGRSIAFLLLPNMMLVELIQQ